MPNLQYVLTQNEQGDKFLTVFLDDEAHVAYVAAGDHPNFDKILAQVIESDTDGLASLFDVSNTVAEQFERVSDRVSVRGGTVYFDGDPVESALTKHILRYIDEGHSDWESLVNFFEKVQSNPNEHSREQLYRFLDANDFTITHSGNIVGYKGVRFSADSDGYTSVQSGYAIVNGKEVHGRIPNNPGDVIEMPRSQVTHDPAQPCSHGLHIATYDYASTWTYVVDAVVEVEVNPRDVVSVPNDHNSQKVRCCRYTVVEVIDANYDCAYR